MNLKIENNRVAYPFSVEIDSNTGNMKEYDVHIERWLKDLTGMFYDRNAAEEYLVENGNIKIYEVYENAIPEVDGEIRFCSSITYPGKIGDEYFMTKGHFHSRPDTAELYYCLRGHGYMMMEKKNGEYVIEEMYPGKAVYVPGYYAHRSINIGNKPLISLPVYPGDAGHDYGTIERSGFKHLVVERNGKPTIIENPNWLAIE